MTPLRGRGSNKALNQLVASLPLVSAAIRLL
jgi:hypothetical protein